MDQNTVGLYHLNEGIGTTLIDASGRNNHGTLQRGAWTNSGRFGNGILLDGIDDYFEIPSPDQLGLQNAYTIEVWVKPFEYRIEPCCDNSTCVFSASREQYEFFMFEPQGQGATRFIPDRSTQMDGGSLQIGDWNYILASVDGQGRACFYINNVFQLDSTGVSKPSDSQLINFGRRVSGYFGTFHLNGIIDEIRISNIARLPGQ